MNDRKTGLILILGISLACTALPLYAWKVYQHSGYMDFDVYFRAAERLKNFDWASVYTLQDGASPFRYSPLFLPFFRPLAELNLREARLLWFFSQYFCFTLGFYGIYRAVRLCLNPADSKIALSITCLSLLFVFRFCLDTFTIGQVSGFMFLGFSAALYAWMLGKPAISSASLLIPALLKIGPGFLFGLFVGSSRREQRIAFSTAILIVLSLLIFSWVWVGSSTIYRALWTGWSSIVAQDSVYFDASHYGSQSLRSALLRMDIDLQSADLIHQFLGGALCVGVAVFWLLRRPRFAYGRGLFFALGIFVYLWLMPETFKYSLTALAIPVAFLFLSLNPALKTIKRGRLGTYALIFGAFTLSLAGKDIIGDFLFFRSQVSSIPFLSTVLLGSAVFQLAWQNSNWSSLGRRILFRVHKEI